MKITIILIVFTLLTVGSINKETQTLEVTLLANSIDYMQTQSLFEDVQIASVKINKVTIEEFKRHQSNEIIFIMGGPKAPEGVGEIVDGLLTEYEKARLLDSTESKRVFVKPSAYPENKVVVIFAGFEKEQTRQILAETKDEVLRMLRFNDEDYEENTQIQSVTIPDINPSQAFTEIDAHQSAQIIKDIEDLVLIDVRAPAIYQVGHIPGSINIPEHKLEKNLKKLNPDKTYLLYCGGNSQSINVGKILAKKGYNNIYRLVDGYVAWRKAGYPREKE